MTCCNAGVLCNCISIAAPHYPTTTKYEKLASTSAMQRTQQLQSAASRDNQLHQRSLLRRQLPKPTSCCCCCPAIAPCAHCRCLDCLKLLQVQIEVTLGGSILQPHSSSSSATSQGSSCTANCMLQHHLCQPDSAAATTSYAHAEQTSCQPKFPHQHPAFPHVCPA
jgi:hypothetical protein